MVKKQSRMSIKDFLSDTLIIGMSAAILWHFSAIWRYGQYLAQEPNIVIRSTETAEFLAILVFGIYKFTYDIRRLQKLKRRGTKTNEV